MRAIKPPEVTSGWGSFEKGYSKRYLTRKPTVRGSK
jgi:hypothetical protein